MSLIIPDILLLFAADGQDMDVYLSEEFAQMIEYPLFISHKRIEDIEDNIANIETCIEKSNAFLIILSEEFLNIIYILSEKILLLFKRMEPSKTILLFCGCRESDLTAIHRHILSGYQRCHKLVATVSDVKQFTINTIKCLQNILQLNRFDENRHKICAKRRNIITNTTEFELSTEKIFEANEKIYILLDSAISEAQRIHLSVGVSNDILIVNWKNPFTLYFTIPEFMVTFNDFLEISLICGHRHLGTRRIICMKTNRKSVDSNIGQTENGFPMNERKNSIDDNFANNSENHCKSYTENVFKPKLPEKSRQIFFNRDDYYLLPEKSHSLNKSDILRQKHLTRSLDRMEFENMYCLYDIPKSLTHSPFGDNERQVFV